MAEITIASVLEDTLKEHRKMLEIASDKYTGLVPKKGMEEAFERERKKCEVLSDLIIGLKSNGVRSELAKWQRDRMAAGGPPERLEI